MAKPKFMVICCIELLMVLAMLALFLEISAKAIELILAICSELNKPIQRLTSKMNPTEVCASMKA